MSLPLPKSKMAVETQLRQTNPARFAAGIAIAWIVISSITTAANWPKGEPLRPNEVGDLLAGIFAPPAFALLWASVTIQSRELKAAIHELEQTTEALRGQVKLQQLSLAFSDESLYPKVVCTTASWRLLKDSEAAEYQFYMKLSSDSELPSRISVPENFTMTIQREHAKAVCECEVPSYLKQSPANNGEYIHCIKGRTHEILVHAKQAEERFFGGNEDVDDIVPRWPLRAADFRLPMVDVANRRYTVWFKFENKGDEEGPEVTIHTTLDIEDDIFPTDAGRPKSR
ncbi:MAG: hypothetical protein AAF532_07915 [Planctomycetota bacterium]